MDERDAKIDAEAWALWLAVFREPPAVRAPGTEIIEAVVSTLPPAHYRRDPPAFES